MGEKDKKQKRERREKHYLSDGSGSIVSSSSDDEDVGPTHFPDALFMKSDKRESKKKHKRHSKRKEKDDKKDDKKKKVTRSSSKVKSDEDGIPKSEKAKKKEKRASKAHKDDQKKKKKEKRSSRKHAGEKTPKKEKKRKKEDKKKKDKKHSKHRHKTREEFGGRAMPRQQTKASSSVDGTAGSGDASFLDTLENLIGTDIGGRILGKHSKDSRSLEGRGSSHSRRESRRQEKQKKHIPNKHKYSGTSDNQGLSQSLHNVSGHHRGGGGRYKKGRNGDTLRVEGPPDSGRRGMFETLHDNMPNGLTLPSNLGFHQFGNKENSREGASLHESMPSGLDLRDSNRSRRSHRSMHDSMPSGLDAGRDRSMRSKRSVDLDGSRRGERSGRINKQSSFHDSMPAGLDCGRDDRSMRHRRGSGSERKSSKGRTSRDYNASVSDRLNLSDTNRHRTDRRKTGDRKTRDLNASTSDRLNPSGTRSAGKVKRPNPREAHTGAHEQMEDKREPSTSSRNRQSGTLSKSFGDTSLTKDEECLLKCMSLSQIKDLYFTEIGFFDWKKWHKQKLQNQKKKPVTARGKKINLLLADADRTPDKRRRGSSKTKMEVDKASRTKHPKSSQIRSSAISKQKNGRNGEMVHNQEGGVDKYDLPTSTAIVDDENKALGAEHVTMPYERDDGHAPIRVKESEGTEGPIYIGTNAKGANVETPEVPEKPEGNPADLTNLQVADAELPQIGTEEADDASSHEGPPAENMSLEACALGMSEIPVSQSGSVEVGESVEDSDESPPNQFVRVDSAARELAKLTEFMTTIDVLSNQEAVEMIDALANQQDTKKSANEAEEKDPSCCAIL